MQEVSLEQVNQTLTPLDHQRKTSSNENMACYMDPQRTKSSSQKWRLTNVSMMTAGVQQTSRGFDKSLNAEEGFKRQSTARFKNEPSAESSFAASLCLGRPLEPAKGIKTGHEGSRAVPSPKNGSILGRELPTRAPQGSGYSVPVFAPLLSLYKPALDEDDVEDLHVLPTEEPRETE